MPIEIKMPALSPTMEQGKLAKWLVTQGDQVVAGDILAEIETDKATMEFEAVDEGTIATISVPEGTDNVTVGTVIAVLVLEDEDPTTASVPAQAGISAEHKLPPEPKEASASADAPETVRAAAPSPALRQVRLKEGRIPASPLAKRLAAEKGVDLSSLKGSGPNGRIVKADVEAAQAGTAKPTDAAPAEVPAPAAAEVPGPAPAASEKPTLAKMVDETRALLDDRVPHSIQRVSQMRKTIARRLSQSMQQAPHIYLTVDIKLDRLLVMRSEMNAAPEKQGIKLSVNDLLIKALGKALVDVPECNVTFAEKEIIRYERADISVAVSISGGLITPIVQDASGRSLSSIAAAMKDLATRAQEGKLESHEYIGGTASLSNMGMMGIKQFTAVINPPQSTILAIGAGEKRPWVMPDGGLGVATVMSATGSFDHRSVDGADGARLMAAFREYVEAPLGMVA
jgi:pyruvate dehydrogenase E2 component (dihydrolipoamide acetyltransferase)